MQSQNSMVGLTDLSTQNSLAQPDTIIDDQKKQAALHLNLILDALAASGQQVDEIQFNFQLKDTPFNKNILITLLTDRQWLDEFKKKRPINDDAIFTQIKIKLTTTQEISITELNDNYDSALKKRAVNFKKAAELIIDNTFDSIGILKQYKGCIQLLYDNLIQNIQHINTNLKQEEYESKCQACYQHYLLTLENVLQDCLNEGKEKKAAISQEEIKKYLRNAESLINIAKQREHKTVISISGSPNTNSTQSNTNNYHFQIDKPKKTFNDLSDRQKNAWKAAIGRYLQNQKVSHSAGKDQPTGFDWFDHLPDYEKKYWAKKFNSTVTIKTLQDKTEVPMAEILNPRTIFGPVVSKLGMPGLRNLMLSSFATAHYDDTLKRTKMTVTAESVRSSNFSGQEKEGTKQSSLSYSERKCSAENLEQACVLHEKLTTPQNRPWTFDENRKKHVLFQTLLRTRGGGDDYVIEQKDAAKRYLDVIKKPQRYYHVSNHCIGTPYGLFSKPLHILMHLLGANKKDVEHMTDAFGSFINMVQGTDQFKLSHTSRQIQNLQLKANKGLITDNDLKTLDFLRVPQHHNQVDVDAQIQSLTLVLSAQSDYIRINNYNTCYHKRYQLHLAALENILYEETGNIVQSSCKSGKDREGVLKCYRNAMYAYFADHGELPPADKNDSKRQLFIDYFEKLFLTHHQAILAEFNSNGSMGMKALKNILPTDILERPAIKNVLEIHKKNSSLMDYGHASVKPDPEELLKYKYKDFVDFARELCSIEPFKDQTWVKNISEYLNQGISDPVSIHMNVMRAISVNIYPPKIKITLFGKRTEPLYHKDLNQKALQFALVNYTEHPEALLKLKQQYSQQIMDMKQAPSARPPTLS